MAQSFVQRSGSRIDAVKDLIADLLVFDGPRRQVAGLLSGLDVAYDSGDLGEATPSSAGGCPTSTSPRPTARSASTACSTPPVRCCSTWVSHLDLGPWADRVRHVEAAYDGAWELPVIGVVDAPTAVLIRPDGHVAWVGDGSDEGLAKALTRWFGTESAQAREPRGGP